MWGLGLTLEVLLEGSSRVSGGVPTMWGLGSLTPWSPLDSFGLGGVVPCGVWV